MADQKIAVLNKKVPAFSADSTSGEKLKSSQLKGQKIILYFYPKDSTPGCTTEGLDFQANLSKFKKQNCIVLGVSRDSLSSHDKFRDKQGFKFDLLSDPEEKLCKLFDVIKEKNLYGKKHMGIERSTFLIDERGFLMKEWRKVKVKGHVDEVLNAVKEL